MNSAIFVTLLCMAGAVSASGFGHGALALSGHYDGGYGGYGGYGGIHKYGPAPLAHDGRVVDTPEVAHLKAQHAAAHAAASARAPAHGAWSGHEGYAAAAPAYGGWSGGHGGYSAPAPAPAWSTHGGYAAAPAYGHYGKWTGPAAHVELTHDGKFLKDTPEVSHAKAAHAAAYSAAAHAAAASPDYHSYDSGYGHGSAYGHGW